MVCLDCGRPAATWSSYCTGCRNRHRRQYLAASFGFWHKFTTKSGRYTRQYNFARPTTGPAAAAGSWLHHLLLLPKRVLQRLRRPH